MDPDGLWRGSTPRRTARRAGGSSDSSDDDSIVSHKQERSGWQARAHRHVEAPATDKARLRDTPARSSLSR